MSMFSTQSAWRLFVALAVLSAGRSQDSKILDLEVLDEIDLKALGTPNLDRYQVSYNLTVDDSCNYNLLVEFTNHEKDVPGDAQPNFEGVCAPNNTDGKAPDGLPWHEARRHWMQFPEYVDQTTGFNHMSLNWLPCGKAPLGLRQPRWDLNFYMVIPQYRSFFTCQTFKNPKVCQYNQTDFLGRGHFSLPRLERDPNFLANMPLNFQPDVLEPEAYEYEGLTSYDPDLVPKDPEDWFLPTFHMSTYDGDAVSWRALLPYNFYSGGNSSVSSATMFYVYQRMPRLPGQWNTTYDAPTGRISMLLVGDAGLCGDAFEQAKQAAEEEA